VISAKSEARNHEGTGENDKWRATIKDGTAGIAEVHTSRLGLAQASGKLKNWWQRTRFVSKQDPQEVNTKTSPTPTQKKKKNKNTKKKTKKKKNTLLMFFGKRAPLNNQPRLERMLKQIRGERPIL